MIRRLRLLSGLVMLAYVTMHLANHAVGLISLKAMEVVRHVVATRISDSFFHTDVGY